MLLHEAIVKVLRERNSELKTQEIADEVNGRRLYTRKDGKPVPAWQIRLRSRNYNKLFDLDSDIVRLVEWNQGKSKNSG